MYLFELWFSQGIGPVVGLLGHKADRFYEGRHYINYALINGKILKMITIHIQMTIITGKGLL